MSERGVQFVQNWLVQNASGVMPPEGDDDALGEAYAARCLKAAAVANIPREQIEEDLGELAAYMRDAIMVAREMQPPAGPDLSDEL